LLDVGSEDLPNIQIDQSERVRAQTLANVKVQELAARVAHRAVQDPQRIGAQRGPYDAARLRLEHIKPAHLVKGAAAAPFQAVLRLPFQLVDIGTERIAGLRACLRQVVIGRTFLDQFRQQENVAVAREDELA